MSTRYNDRNNDRGGQNYGRRSESDYGRSGGSGNFDEMTTSCFHMRDNLSCHSERLSMNLSAIPHHRANAA